MEQFTGLVLIQTDDGGNSIRLNGNGSKITIGGYGFMQPQEPPPGSVVPIIDPSPIFTDRVSIDGATSMITVNGADGSPRVSIDGATSTITVNGADGSPLVTLDGAAGNGQFVVRDGEGREVLNFTSANAQLLVGAAGHAGDLIVRDVGGRDVLDFNSATAQLSVGAAGNGGDIIVRNGNGNNSIVLNGSDGSITLGGTDTNGDIIVKNNNNKETIVLDGADGSITLGGDGTNGDIIVKNNNDIETIKITGSNGDIEFLNADFAEEFEVKEAMIKDTLPGMLMIVDEDSKLVPCEKPYDSRVVGIIAGGGNCRPGIVMDKNGGKNRLPVAMIGKVYCLADADTNPIKVGDMLTTSSKKGHAMKVTDKQKAFGTVVGKALSGLAYGTGLIPVLVNLQ